MEDFGRRDAVNILIHLIGFFEKMGIPGGKKTKTGYSTAADVLEKLAPDHFGMVSPRYSLATSSTA